MREQARAHGPDREPDPGALELRLPPQPASVAAARRMVREMLADASQQDLIETAVLLVSEVVTNALLHAGTPIELVATAGPDGLLIEVRDGSAHAPVRRRYGPTAGTGRGLLMLDQMVDDWGVSPREDGKTVWFRLSAGAGTRSSRATDPEEENPPSEHPPSAREEGTVDVELRNMPLLLHSAWREHAETLLREYLLVNLDEDGERDPIQVHAEATDAIAILEEHVPEADVALDPDRLVADATEPRVSATTVDVPVPLTSVPHFATLDRAIEDALALARAGVVLTPPTQPEVRDFRHWMCQQVLEQARGGRPLAWEMDGSGLDEPWLELDWDAAAVEQATIPTIAADEANRILAVSPSVGGLLGYDDPQELLGQRIVTVVPERYRQAHIAGFTLFLLVGRRPLVDRPVSVPARRRDGAEVPVELTVRVLPAGEGRSVFVAEMRPESG